MLSSRLRGKEAHGEVVPVPATKLKPRIVDDSWVERQRLISRLEQGATKRLTIISAPAGYGKSCLASQWLHSSPKRSAWLSLDDQDDNLDAFVRCVIAALRSKIPGFGLEVEEILSGPRMPPPGVLADCLAHCVEPLIEPIWLVFDDIHKVSSPEVNSFVSRLLANLPETLRLVILTRKDPAWLRQRWVVQDWINRLRAADLSFTLQETQAFFQRVGSHLDEQAAKVIHSKFEGWIAGLQLAQLSGLTGCGQLEHLLRSAGEEGRIFSNFLVEEVISQQSAEVQNFLGVSSLFDRFCAPLCNAVLGKSSEEAYSIQIIKHLQESNLFLIPLDSEGVWFRYHHLFSDVLRSLSRLRPSVEQLTCINSVAGRWFSEQKLVPEALKSFLAAGEIDTAAAFLEEHLHGIILADLSRRTLKRYLEMFPPQVQSTHPGLLVADAWCYNARLDTHQVAERLDRAEALFQTPSLRIPGTQRKELQCDINSLRSVCCFWDGDCKAAVLFASRTLHSKSGERHFARSVATLYRALGLALSGRKESALKLISDEMRAAVQSGSPSLGMHLAGQMWVEYFSGDYDSAKNTGLALERAAETSHVQMYYLPFAVHVQGRVAIE